MKFEEALCAEAKAIQALGNVYPILGKQDGPFPFLTYEKGKITFPKTMDGFMSKVDAIYKIHIVAKNYTTLSDAYESVLALFKGFLHRQIGTNGPLIENVNVEVIGDRYDPATEYMVTEIQLEVIYKEV